MKNGYIILDLSDVTIGITDDTKTVIISKDDNPSIFTRLINCVNANKPVYLTNLRTFVDADIRKYTTISGYCVTIGVSAFSLTGKALIAENTFLESVLTITPIFADGEYSQFILRLDGTIS